MDVTDYVRGQGPPPLTYSHQFSSAQISAAPQSRPWSARRGGIAHSAQWAGPIKASGVTVE
jgi:hypothetical protein